MARRFKPLRRCICFLLSNFVGTETLAQLCVANWARNYNCPISHRLLHCPLTISQVIQIRTCLRSA